jgi:hypothetical protein
MPDVHGKPITGDLSQRYILKRKTQFGNTMKNTGTMTLIQKKMAGGIEFHNFVV